MPKKIMSFLLCLAVLFSAAGCSGMLEEEYYASEVHLESEPPVFNDTVTSEVKDYAELKTEILRIISAGRAGGTIRFVGYSGDVERDISDACIDVSHNTALGAYAVFHINFSVNKIVSYYEADINITYKKTQEQIRNIITLTSLEDFSVVLENIMSTGSPYLAIMTSMEGLNAETIRQAVEHVYYTRPVSLLCLPEVTVGIYPENAEEKIVEIALTYPFSGAAREERQVELSDAAGRVARRYVEYSDGRALLNLCDYLSSMVARVEEQPQEGEETTWDSRATAYGALVERAANSEGIAMGYKTVCDALGIECGVVIGKYNGEEHAWNIVNLNGDYYHVDVANCSVKGIAGVFLKSDDEMVDEYWWNIEQYPSCNGVLNYYDVA